MSHNLAEVLVAGMICATFVTTFAIFMFWRRRPAPSHDPRMAELLGRLERIEQAVDTIAIEIERVSEGQRFTSKLLVERESHTREPSRQITPH